METANEYTRRRTSCSTNCAWNEHVCPFTHSYCNRPPTKVIAYGYEHVGCVAFVCDDGAKSFGRGKTQVLADFTPQVEVAMNMILGSGHLLFGDIIKFFMDWNKT